MDSFVLISALFSEILVLYSVPKYQGYREYFLMSRIEKCHKMLFSEKQSGYNLRHLHCIPVP